MRDDVGGPIRLDRQVDVWLQRRFAHRSRGSSARGRAKQLFGHQPYAEYKRPGSEHALKESAAAAEQLTVAVGNILDMDHAPSLRYWTKMDAKPSNTSLHPTANSFSCKPGGGMSARLPGIKSFHALEKW